MWTIAHINNIRAIVSLNKSGAFATEFIYLFSAHNKLECVAATRAHSDSLHMWWTSPTPLSWHSCLLKQKSHSRHCLQRCGRRYHLARHLHCQLSHSLHCQLDGQLCRHLDRHLSRQLSRQLDAHRCHRRGRLRAVRSLARLRQCEGRLI